MSWFRWFRALLWPSAIFTGVILLYAAVLTILRN